MHYIEVTSQLVLVLITSAFIGHNRGVKNQVAGMRTHILVAIGSCLAVQIALNNPNLPANADPYRLSAQVISGIGFLGAGTIIQQGKIIKGLTTAASLWTTAIIAIAIGSNEYYLALLAFSLVLFSLSVIGKIQILSTDKYLEKTLLISYVYSYQNKQKLYETLKQQGISSKYENILKQKKTNGKITSYSTIEIRYVQKNIDLNEIIINLMSNDFVNTVEFTQTINP